MGLLDDFKPDTSKKVITPDSNMLGVIPASSGQGKEPTLNEFLSQPVNKPILDQLPTANPTFTGTSKELNSFLDNGVSINGKATRSELEKQRAKNQQWYKQALNSAIQAVGVTAGDAISGIGAIIDVATFGLMDDEAYSNAITRFGDSIGESVRSAAPIYRVNPDKAFDGDDISGWMFSHLPSVVSSLGLLPAGGMVTKGANLAFKGAKLLTPAKTARYLKGMTGLDKVVNANRAASVANAATGAIGMRVGENYKEAGQVMESIRNEALPKFNEMTDDQFLQWKLDNPDSVQDINFSREELANSIAERAADRSFAYNSVNVVFDFVQLHALNKFAKGLTSRSTSASLRETQRQAIRRVNSSTGGAEVNPRAYVNAVNSTIKKLNVFKNSTNALLVSEWTEGIEEAVNFIGGEEGTEYGKYLMKESEHSSFNAVSTDRLADYIKNPHLWNSALWGVIGGVVFGGATNYVNSKNWTPGKDFFTDSAEAVAEKQRAVEINNRDIKFRMYGTMFDRVNDNLNPYVQATSVDGSPLFVDEKGFPTTTDTGVPLSAEIKDEADKELVVNAIRTDAITDIALDAIRVGNYELLEEYVNNPEVKSLLIESGVVSEDTYESDMDFVRNIMDKTLTSYNNHRTNLINAGIDDILADMIISDNILNEVESDRLYEQSNQLQDKIQTIISNNPTLTEKDASGEIDDAYYSLLVQIQKAIRSEIIGLKSDNEYASSEKRQQLLGRLATIDKVLVSSANLGDLPAASEYTKAFYDEIGLEYVPEYDPTIPDVEGSLKLNAGKRRSVKAIDAIANINKEVIDLMLEQIKTNVYAEEIKGKIVFDESKARAEADRRKAELERAASNLVDTASNLIVSAFNNTSNRDDLAKLESILEGTQPTDSNDNDLYQAGEVLRLHSKDAKAIISKEYNNALARIIAKEEAAARIAEQERIKAEEELIKAEEDVRLASEQSFTKSNDKPVDNPVDNQVVNQSESNSVPTIVDTEADKKATVIINELANTSVPVLSKETLKNYTFKQLREFEGNTDDGFVTISNIEVRYNKRGIPFIEVNDGNSDMTIDNFINAVELGHIEATPKVLASAIDEGTSMLDVLKQQQAKLSKMVELLGLYNKAIGAKSIGSTATFNVEDFMRYVKSKNGSAVDNYDEFKQVILDMASKGNILITDDVDVKSQSKEDIVSAISKNRNDSIKEVLKHNEFATKFGIEIFEPNFNSDKLNVEDAKLYDAINSIKSGSYIRGQVVDDAIKLSTKGVVIGRIKLPDLEDGKVVSILEGWNYRIDSAKVGYTIGLIEDLKNLVYNDSELIGLLDNFRSVVNASRYNDTSKLLSDLTSAILANADYQRLVDMYSNPIHDSDKLINHLAKIVIFDKKVSRNSELDKIVVIDNLTKWEQKLGYSYKGVIDIYDRANKNKDKTTKIHVDSTTSGRLKLTSVVDGKPVYNKISDVVRNDQSNNRAININSKGQAYIEIFDSEGRATYAYLKNNSATNKLSKQDPFTTRFNNSLTRVFKELVTSALSNDITTRDIAFNELSSYIGSGKLLYGYNLVKKGENVMLLPNENFDLPHIYINKGYVTVTHGSVKIGSYGTIHNGVDLTNKSVTNVTSIFMNALDNLSRNVIREDFNYTGAELTGRKSTTTDFVEGKYRIRYPSISTSEYALFDSVNQYLIDTDALVTTVEAVRDDKGNILGNFEFKPNANNIGLNKNIYINVRKPVISFSEQAIQPVNDIDDGSNVAPPVKDEQTSVSPTQLAADALTEHLKTDNSLKGVINHFGITEFDLVADMLQVTGVIINPTLTNSDSVFASYDTSNNTITISENLLINDNIRRSTIIIHEALHAQFNKLRADGKEVRTQLADIFHTFKSKLDSDLTNGVITKEVYDALNKFTNSHLPLDVSVEEFVVESLTNRQLAQYLSTIKSDTTDSKSNSLFGKILDIIKDLIATVNSDSRTMLDEIVTKLDQMVNTTIATTATETTVTATPARDNSRDRRRRSLLDSAISDNIGVIPSVHRLTDNLNGTDKQTINSMIDNNQLTTVCK